MSTRPPATVTAVLTTAPDKSVAESLASSVVEERLAACANLIPGVTSIYRWEGEIRTDAEVLVVFKTTDDRFNALRDRVLELHPYDVPEVLALPVPEGSADYLDWVREEVDAS